MEERTKFTCHLNNKYEMITELNAVEECLVKCRRNGFDTQHIDHLIYAIDYQQIVALVGICGIRTVLLI